MFFSKKYKEGNVKDIVNKAYAISAKRIDSSRALYQSEEIQRIELRIETRNGDMLTIEMTPGMARKTVIELGSAYTAINPQMPNPFPTGE